MTSASSCAGAQAARAAGRSASSNGTSAVIKRSGTGSFMGIHPLHAGRRRNPARDQKISSLPLAFCRCAVLPRFGERTDAEGRSKTAPRQNSATAPTELTQLQVIVWLQKRDPLFPVRAGDHEQRPVMNLSEKLF